LLNFLARLADRGFISVTRCGKSNLYAPLVNERDYLQRESKSFLERMHGNSLKSLVAALYGGEAISEDDLAELKGFIDERVRGSSINNEGGNRIANETLRQSGADKSISFDAMSGSLYIFD
jgi:hypothetical protein